METAWGEGNYIAVGSWPSMNNGGDLIGIWDDADEYAIDGEAAGDRSADGAIFSVNYLDGDEDWPNVGQGNSISIIDLSDSADTGGNWSLSIDDGDSSFANEVISSLEDHAGGDMGSPGTFGEVDPPVGLDLNGDGSINAGDAPLVCDAAGGDVAAFLIENGGIQGDFDLSGTVDFARLLAPLCELPYRRRLFDRQRKLRGADRLWGFSSSFSQFWSVGCCRFCTGADRSEPDCVLDRRIPSRFETKAAVTIDPTSCQTSFCQHLVARPAFNAGRAETLTVVDGNQLSYDDRVGSTTIWNQTVGQ